MHQDSYENDQNVRHHRTRWTMAFYYPQDVSLEMGPTAILPATQYYNSSKQAYEREEQPLCGRAGTVTIVHYDLWHRAMPNASGRDRFMVKFLFTRMGEPQTPSWDHRDGTWQTEGIDPPAELCRRAWDWMRGTDGTAAPTAVSLDELHQALDADTEAERLRAVYALAARGEEAMLVLLNALRGEAAARLETNLANAHTNPSQLDAIFALSAVGRPAVPHMVELLGENCSAKTTGGSAPRPPMYSATWAPQRPTPCLTSPAPSSNDEAEWVRRNAVEALGNIGQAAAEAVPALSHRLRDSESWIRHNAALSLAKIGPAATEAVSDLRKNIDDERLVLGAQSATATPHRGWPRQCGRGPRAHRHLIVE